MDALTTSFASYYQDQQVRNASYYGTRAVSKTHLTEIRRGAARMANRVADYLPAAVAEVDRFDTLDGLSFNADSDEMALALQWAIYRRGWQSTEFTTFQLRPDGGEETVVKVEGRIK